MRQRQHAADDPAALSNQVMRRVTEGPFDDPLPTGEMKERSARVGEHELVPALLVIRPERSYDDTWLRPVQEATTGNGPLSLPRKSRSMRVQAKLRSRRRSLGSVRFKFK